MPGSIVSMHTMGEVDALFLEYSPSLSVVLLWPRLGNIIFPIKKASGESED